MTKLKFILFISVLLNVKLVWGQQIRLDDLDAQPIYLKSTITVHHFIDEMHSESKTHKIKEKVELIAHKGRKPKVQFRSHFHPDGTINYKVGYIWRGGDSSRVSYTYDSINRLVRARNYNSKFGRNDAGQQISFFYNSENEIISCKTKDQIVNFTYNANGTKNSVEIIKFTHFIYPSIKNPKHHVYDTITSLYYYQYDQKDNLKYIMNDNNDTISSLKFDGNKKMVEMITSKSFIHQYAYESDLMVKNYNYEISYPSNKLILFDGCDYSYVNGLLTTQDCRTEIDFLNNYSIQYFYNENKLLIEEIHRNKKGKISHRILYTYSYY